MATITSAASTRRIRFGAPVLAKLVVYANGSIDDPAKALAHVAAG